MQINWDTPVSVSVITDITDPDAVSLRRSGDGIVQLLIGQNRQFTITTAGSNTSVELTAESESSTAAPRNVDNVLAVEIADSIADDSTSASGDEALPTALSAADDTTTTEQSSTSPHIFDTPLFATLAQPKPFDVASDAVSAATGGPEPEPEPEPIDPRLLIETVAMPIISEAESTAALAASTHPDEHSPEEHSPEEHSPVTSESQSTESDQHESTPLNTASTEAPIGNPNIAWPAVVLPGVPTGPIDAHTTPTVPGDARTELLDLSAVREASAAAAREASAIANRERDEAESLAASAPDPMAAATQSTQETDPRSIDLHAIDVTGETPRLQAAPNDAPQNAAAQNGVARNDTAESDGFDETISSLTELGFSFDTDALGVIVDPEAQIEAALTEIREARATEPATDPATALPDTVEPTPHEATAASTDTTPPADIDDTVIGFGLPGEPQQIPAAQRPASDSTVEDAVDIDETVIIDETAAVADRPDEPNQSEPATAIMPIIEATDAAEADPTANDDTIIGLDLPTPIPSFVSTSTATPTPLPDTAAATPQSPDDSASFDDTIIGGIPTQSTTTSRPDAPTQPPTGNSFDDTIMGVDLPAPIDAGSSGQPFAWTLGHNGDTNAGTNAGTNDGNTTQQADDTMVDATPAPNAAPALDVTAHVPAVVPEPIPGLPPIPSAATSAAAVTALYSLRTTQGNVFLIDRTLYVGRAPRSPRITSGLEPLLVAVPSPGREVSSTHLEISQEGTTIVVRDLSSNGTIVIPPGHAPTLLSPGQSRVVTLGTRFDLGDQNVLEILPAEAYSRANR